MFTILLVAVYFTLLIATMIHLARRDLAAVRADR
jgi:hypothetical protein